MNELPASWSEYVELYLADLLESLGHKDRVNVLNSLSTVYMGGPYPSRELVQRLVEYVSGTITGDQYRSWVSEPSGSAITAVDHIVDALERGFFVGAPGATTLVFLANAEYQPPAIARLSEAVAKGRLTEEERLSVLEEAMRNSPRPDLVPLPNGLQPLPPDFPEPRRDSSMQVAPPDSE